MSKYLTVFAGVLRRAADRVRRGFFSLNVTPTAIFIVAVVLVYILAFIWPIFLSQDTGMWFPHYIQAAGDRTGGDLRGALTFANSLKDTFNPYVAGNFYSPLNSVFFLPLTLFGDRAAYWFITLFTIGIYLLAGWLSFKFLSPHVNKTILALLLVLGLFSYGFQFEIERGQSNVLTMAIGMLAVYLFHFTPTSKSLAWGFTRFRWLSYVLFTIAVHIKIYPIVLLVFFVKDSLWNKRDVLRVVSLFAANTALFFVFGTKMFQSFWSAIKQIQLYAGVGHAGEINHSIFSFTHTPNYPFLQQYYGILLLVIVAAFFVSVLPWFISAFDIKYRLRYLLPIAGMLTFFIPSVSYDYKLSLLPLYFIFYFSLEQKMNWLQKLIFALVAVLVNFAFSPPLHLDPISRFLPTWVVGNKFLSLFSVYLLLCVDSLIFLIRNRADIFMNIKTQPLFRRFFRGGNVAFHDASWHNTRQ